MITLTSYSATLDNHGLLTTLWSTPVIILSNVVIFVCVPQLSLRMERHVQNAEKIAAWLESHDAVAGVTYAGLDSSPYKARKDAFCPKGAGGLFTIKLKAGYDACVKFVDTLELFSHVANLGDTRSLVIHSASTTHRQLTPAQQEAAGAGPDVVRISIGIEDADDLIADLDQALKAASA